MARALSFARFGPPEEVLTWGEFPQEGKGVSLRIEASPINPADLNRIEGTYGTLPELPAVGGLEGVARNVESGELVRLPRGVGYWRDECLVPAEALKPFPPGLTVPQAALFQVNPATAWGLLHEFTALKPGDWIAQNAATSDVGRHVIALARHYGWRTLNLVRKEEDAALLREAGADAAVLADAEPEAILQATGGARPVLALNAVGGESAALLSRLLAPGSPHVTYGAMARQPVRVSNRDLIFNDLSFRGFWLSRWREKVDPARFAAMETELAALFASGVLAARVEASYPFSQYKEAIAHARREGKRGKILFVAEEGRAS